MKNDHVCDAGTRGKITRTEDIAKGHKVKSEEDRCYCIPLLVSLQHLGKMEVVKEHVSIAAYANTYTYMCTVLNYPSLSV